MSNTKVVKKNLKHSVCFAAIIAKMRIYSKLNVVQICFMVIWLKTNCIKNEMLYKKLKIARVFT